MLSNYDPMEMKAYDEVKENIQGDLLENGDTRGTSIESGENKGEQAPDLNQRVSVMSVLDFIESEIDLVATGANERSEPRFLKDLREKKYTILELEELEKVFRQDVRLSNPIPHHVSSLP